MHKCRLCNSDLTSSNDSEAHIIPNALGGRLKPKGILCKNCNTMLDNLADNALIKAFGDWPTVLNIPRDRGRNPPKILETRNGKIVRVEPHGSITRVDVLYDVAPTEEGYSVEIGAGDMKTVRQLLKRAAKQFPQLDPSIAEQHAKTVGIKDDDELKLLLDFSPQATFGGIITAIWLFLILKTGRAFMDHARLASVIKEMRSHGGTFRYFVNGLPGLQGPDVPLNHKIVVRSVPSTGELIAYVEILGVLKVGGIFAKSFVPCMALEQIYAYDILGRQDVSGSFSVDPETFEQQNWSMVGLGPADAEQLREHFRTALEQVFVKHYRARFAENGSDE
ncbi:HNH endonuclease [Propionicimonas sp.]|uniref:HNH endonuclease n=1 Tax=Propionicimonas sp. TaxID=1955623 RepID=UPI0039E565CF